VDRTRKALIVEAEGTVEILPARNGRHGIVRADGIPLVYEDG